MTQQSHSYACTLRKPKLKKTQVAHCSLQLEHGSNLDVHLQMNGVLLSHKKEHIRVSSDEVDEPRTYYTE